MTEIAVLAGLLLDHLPPLPESLPEDAAVSLREADRLLADGRAGPALAAVASAVDRVVAAADGGLDADTALFLADCLTLNLDAAPWARGQAGDRNGAAPSGAGGLVIVTPDDEAPPRRDAIARLEAAADAAGWTAVRFVARADRVDGAPFAGDLVAGARLALRRLAPTNARLAVFLDALTAPMVAAIAFGGVAPRQAAVATGDDPPCAVRRIDAVSTLGAAPRADVTARLVERGVAVLPFDELLTAG
jgi:hypothetical protein